ncbi:MAG: endonuclease/exonuclease/phosphatase family protein [Prevotellaceae bacterium]|nr:endonuclease/exonuclease/phosphatase family protein [Prevotellaceae bacterium]
MRRIFILSLLALAYLSLGAQGAYKQRYGVAFYNLENLFDTLHDAGKNDLEYLPDSPRRWTSYRYEAKLKNLARVMGEIGREELPQGPAVIGVAEAENARVLTDLVAQPELRKYRFIHYEGPDKRGIDCALLYNRHLFKPRRSQLVLSQPYEGDTVHLTRGFLIVRGKMGGDKVCFIVNHWPSRGAQSPVRVHAARQVRHLTDSLMQRHKGLKIIVMGDLNDDPMDESLAMLGGRKYRNEVASGDFYNPWWEMLQDRGIGTLLYRGKWNLFDQILINEPLLQAQKGLRYDTCEVFRRPWLFEQEGRYKGSPHRTYSGNKWLNGYSDHLPTLVYLVK